METQKWFIVVDVYQVGGNLTAFLKEPYYRSLCVSLLVPWQPQL